MKTPVSDTSVQEYVAKISAGIPTGDVFPCRMSDCEFTAAQREIIKQARADLKAAKKNGNGLTATPIQTKQPAKSIPPTSKGTVFPETKTTSAKPLAVPEAKP